MNRYALTILCATLLGACAVAGPETMAASTGSGGGNLGGGGGAASVCDNTCDDGNPCTEDTCNAGKCAHDPLPAGTICEGAATDPIHGECEEPPAAVCAITEWTCVKGKPGDKCIGGICAVNHVCCSGGCIDPMGFCTFGPSGGVPCPKM